MFDDKLKYSLENILEHISKCEIRFSKIENASDFVLTDEGDILLDALAARLQAIGENIKNISKIYPQILFEHPQVEWNNIIRFRDYISHHYELLDHEIVYQIGKVFLPELKKTILLELKKFEN